MKLPTKKATKINASSVQNAETARNIRRGYFIRRARQLHRNPQHPHPAPSLSNFSPFPSVNHIVTLLKQNSQQIKDVTLFRPNTSLQQRVEVELQSGQRKLLVVLKRIPRQTLYP